MTMTACLRVPTTVTIRNSRGVVVRDSASRCYGFVELARQLEELRGLRARIIRDGEATEACDVVMVSDLAYLSEDDDAAANPGLLLDALPNSYLRMALAGLLGAVDC